MTGVRILNSAKDTPEIKSMELNSPYLDVSFPGIIVHPQEKEGILRI